MAREFAVNVEMWDETTGTWMDLGEARNHDAAVIRVHGLKAADTSEQSYRVVETTTITYGPKGRS